LPAGTASLSVESIALCHQIRTLDKSRLARHLGEVTEDRLRREVLEALRFQLEL